MIQVSDAAAKRISQLINDEGLTPKTHLRVHVKKGGCSGFTYKMDFDEQANETDKIFQDNNVSLIVDKESLLYIIGMTLDFEGGLNGQGFLFKNPNASKTCGCGSSFAV